MAKKWPIHRPRRKQRTRQHIIADLSANHVERHIFSCGFAAELRWYDYGIDMTLYFYSPNGEPQNEQVFLQLKATDHLKLSHDGKKIVFRLDCRDLDYWLHAPSPVILVVYDAKAEKAYWLYVQAHFEADTSLKAWKTQRTITVKLPMENVVDKSAVLRFQRYNNDVMQQLGKIHHDV